jgi:hypothetical protein
MQKKAPAGTHPRQLEFAFGFESLIRWEPASEKAKDLVATSSFQTPSAASSLGGEGQRLLKIQETETPATWRLLASAFFLKENGNVGEATVRR